MFTGVCLSTGRVPSPGGAWSWVVFGLGGSGHRGCLIPGGCLVPEGGCLVPGGDPRMAIAVGMHSCCVKNLVGIQK